MRHLGVHQVIGVYQDLSGARHDFGDLDSGFAHHHPHRSRVVKAFYSANVIEIALCGLKECGTVPG